MELDGSIMGQEYKKHLLEVIYARSFKHDPENGFTLSSGAKSDVYIDIKKTVLSAEGMELVGYAFYQELKLEPIDGIGGLTLGADPIAYSTALTCTINGKALDAFVIRKEPKKHGTMKWVEGNLKDEAWVCIVDDVTTTGASTIVAIERAREAGFKIQKVMCLVDRQEGAYENILAKTGCKLVPMFTKKDLMELHEKHTKALKK